MMLPGFLKLKGIGGQIAALVVASIVALHLIITSIFLISRPDRHDPFAVDGQHQLGLAARLLAAAPPAERPRLLTYLTRSYPELELKTLATEVQSVTIEADHAALRGLIRHLGSDYRIFALAQGQRRIAIALPDGAMISAKIQLHRPSPFLGGPWMMTLLFAVISVTLLGLWAARAGRAAFILCQGSGRFQPEWRCGTPDRTRPRRSPRGGPRAQPHARAHQRTDRRPHQNAGGHKP